MIPAAFAILILLLVVGVVGFMHVGHEREQDKQIEDNTKTFDNFRTNEFTDLKRRVEALERRMPRAN